MAALMPKDWSRLESGETKVRRAVIVIPLQVKLLVARTSCPLKRKTTTKPGVANEKASALQRYSDDRATNKWRLRCRRDSGFVPLYTIGRVRSPVLSDIDRRRVADARCELNHIPRGKRLCSKSSNTSRMM